MGEPLWFGGSVYEQRPGLWAAAVDRHVRPSLGNVPLMKLSPTMLSPVVTRAPRRVRSRMR